MNPTIKPRRQRRVCVVGVKYAEPLIHTATLGSVVHRFERPLAVLKIAASYAKLFVLQPAE